MSACKETCIGDLSGKREECAGYWGAIGDALERLRRDGNVLIAILDHLVIGCLAHLPARHMTIGMPEARKAGPAYEAYGDPFIRDRRYISDSSMHWREGCLCQWLGKVDHLTRADAPHLVV